MQNVLKENYKLRKEVLKLKGEKDKLLHQTVYSNTSSENSSENSLKRIHNNNNTNHFVDLNKDSSVWELLNHYTELSRKSLKIFIVFVITILDIYF